LPQAKKIQADSPVFYGKEAPLYGALKSKKCAQILIIYFIPN
jgi:hypothetical protein